jgi:uncharacterized protein (DUF2235 family)
MDTNHPKIKRLILCLDGTWNLENDLTNISTIYSLVSPVDQHGVTQLRYYDRGVGTGLKWLNKVFGGAIGLGLDENIREAYVWLMNNYNKGDEIFIFGFSRGAYTARSLVGFISYCGLIEPTAPLTINQLFDGYKKRNKLKPFRALYELQHIQSSDQKLINEDFNNAEIFLLNYSRKITIKFVGAFDTVGAVGLRGWKFHNQNPSRVMLNGYQAMAIDEHRKTFDCILWNDFVPSSEPKMQNKHNIEQRWFAGSHANIGGGYPNNPLRSFPLKWMLDKAKLHGLAFNGTAVLPDIKYLKDFSSGKSPLLVDSYSEFLCGMYKHIGIIICKFRRFYRVLSPLPRNVPAELTLTGEVKRAAGIVTPINVTIDDSVIELRKQFPSYQPKNLKEYLENKTITD